MPTPIIVRIGTGNVGNTLVKQAVLKPDCAICNEARIPAPPPPITTASNDNLRSAVMD